MSIWLVIRNIGAIIGLMKSLSGVVSSVIDTKKAPEKEAIKSVLDSIEDLLDRGVIDIPNVDEKAISDALKQIEEQLLK